MGGPPQPRVAVQGPAPVGPRVGQELGDEEPRVVGVADAREQVGGGVLGEGVLGLLQVGDEAVDRDDGPRAGEGGRPRPAPRSQTGGGVAVARPAARLVAAHRATARRRAVWSAWTWWSAGNRVRMAGTDRTGAGRPGCRPGRHRGDQAQGDGATGRSASPRSARCSIAVFRLEVPPGSGRQTRVGQACQSTLNGNTVQAKAVAETVIEPARPGGGRWPSGSARGGWRAELAQHRRHVVSTVFTDRCSRCATSL